MSTWTGSTEGASIPTSARYFTTDGDHIYWTSGTQGHVDRYTPATLTQTRIYTGAGGGSFSGVQVFKDKLYLARVNDAANGIEVLRWDDPSWTKVWERTSLTGPVLRAFYADSYNMVVAYDWNSIANKDMHYSSDGATWSNSIAFDLGGITTSNYVLFNLSSSWVQDRERMLARIGLSSTYYLYKFVDGTWQQATGAGTMNGSYDLAVNSDVIWRRTAASTWQYSNDEGATWQTPASQCWPSPGKNLDRSFALEYTYPDLKIYRWEAGAWVAETTADAYTDGFPIGAVRLSDGSVYMFYETVSSGSGSRIIRLRDELIPFPPDPPDPPPVETYFHIAKTADASATWQTVEQGLGANSVVSLKVKQGQLTAAVQVNAAPPPADGEPLVVGQNPVDEGISLKMSDSRGIIIFNETDPAYGNQTQYVVYDLTTSPPTTINTNILSGGGVTADYLSVERINDTFFLFCSHQYTSNSDTFSVSLCELNSDGLISVRSSVGESGNRTDVRFGQSSVAMLSEGLAVAAWTYHWRYYSAGQYWWAHEPHGASIVVDLVNKTLTRSNIQTFPEDIDQYTVIKASSNSAIVVGADDENDTYDAAGIVLTNITASGFTIGSLALIEPDLISISGGYFWPPRGHYLSDGRVLWSTASKDEVTWEWYGFVLLLQASGSTITVLDKVTLWANEWNGYVEGVSLAGQSATEAIACFCDTLPDGETGEAIYKVHLTISGSSLVAREKVEVVRNSGNLYYHSVHGLTLPAMLTWTDADDSSKPYWRLIY